MEINLPVISKRVWSMVRVAFFMLRKKLSKGKLMTDLNTIKRRGKLAGKVIANIMFHHHHKGSTSSRHSNRSFTSSTQGPPTPFDEAMTMSAMKTAVKTILNTLNYDQATVEASPALSIFERSPRVRQLRVTDSPFPLRDDDEKDNQIDKDAEDFIKRFYSQLRKQDWAIN